jgi:predicted AAA+ superfamily ATPase
MKLSELEKIIEDQRVDFESAPRGIARAGDFEHHFQSPVVSVIQGVRRCGKSTLLRQLADRATQRGFNVCFLTLDDPRLTRFEAKDFEAVYNLWQKSRSFAEHRSIIFLDEVQEVAGWEKWANYFAQQKSHKVFVTGSNSRLLSSELGTYMTGRHLDIYLTPLSLGEIVDALPNADRTALSSAGRAELERAYENHERYGGFPRCVLDRSLSYLPVYYADIVQKDIIVRAKTRNKSAVENLARLMATETSRLFNHSKIARVLKLKDEATVRKYCRLMVQSYLFYELRCFSRSARDQTRSHPKYYSIDHAMAKANGFWKVDDPTRVLELIVCAELIRRGESLFYWRSEKNYEVDFLVTKGTTPRSAIQVSYSIDDPLTEEREVRALVAAHVELGVQDLVLVTRHESRVLRQHGVTIRLVPIVDFLLSTPI